MFSLRRAGENRKKIVFMRLIRAPARKTLSTYNNKMINVFQLHRRKSIHKALSGASFASNYLTALKKGKNSCEAVMKNLMK